MDAVGRCKGRQCGPEQPPHCQTRRLLVAQPAQFDIWSSVRGTKSLVWLCKLGYEAVGGDRAATIGHLGRFVGLLCPGDWQACVRAGGRGQGVKAQGERVSILCPVGAGSAWACLGCARGLCRQCSKEIRCTDSWRPHTRDAPACLFRRLQLEHNLHPHHHSTPHLPWAIVASKQGTIR